MANSWLHESVCRQRNEKYLNVGYMKLCVDRDIDSADSWLQEASFDRYLTALDNWLYEAVWRQRQELWG